MNKLLMICILCFHPLTEASEVANIVEFNIGGDSGDNTNTDLRWNHQRPEHWGYGVSAGSSRQNKSNDNKVNSKSFGLSADYDSQKFWSLGAMFSHWGLKDHLVYNNLEFPIGLRSNNWDLSLTPGSGQLTFETEGLSTNRELKVNTNSFGISVNYDGFYPWLFGFSAHKTNYSEDLTQLLNEQVASVFSESTLSLFSAVVEKRFGFDIGYEFEQFLILWMPSTSTSAIDKSETTSSEFLFEYFPGARWTYILNIGSAKVTDWGLVPVANRTDESFTYASLGLRFQFSQIDTLFRN